MVFRGEEYEDLKAASPLTPKDNPTITPIQPAHIPGAWSFLEFLVAQALAYCAPGTDRTAMLDETRERLLSGQYEAATIATPEATGVVISELCVIDGVKVCWLPFIAGKTELKPKAFIRFMRTMMATYEDMARAQGCEEIRIGGRDWSRVFPDFERFDDMPNRLRKKLWPRPKPAR